MKNIDKIDKESDLFCFIVKLPRNINGDKIITNIIEFITISTEGNAQDFGDLADPVLSHASCASSTRAVQVGGSIPSGGTNTMQYVTIATTGNATDFGDMTVALSGQAALSDVNGGLG